MEPLTVKDLYALSDLALLPSDVEGRGLPVLESSACGVPLVCRRFKPEEVYAELIGEHLPEEDRLRTIEFVEDGFSDDTLDTITQLLFDSNARERLVSHNYQAVKRRFSMQTLRDSFVQYFERLQTL